MTGDYTMVPLRDGDRWTGARMQQGRVLLDHEWNLNVDATARTMADTARDLIGPAGVPEGSGAFRVDFTGQAPLPRRLVIQGGRIWVDGMCAYAPASFQYTSQETAPPLPQTGRALVYLEVFPEHLQPAEAWAEIADPALEPVDAAARQRVGWRVRVVPSAGGSCAQAIAQLGFQPLSTGQMTIGRAAPPGAPDPCDPPGDPLGLLPDGLLRVEVLDSGTATTARFAWTADGGAATARVRQIDGDRVKLATSPSVKLAVGDLVEVSWRTRRADRSGHGPLYTVTNVSAGPAGQELTLNAAMRLPDDPTGLVVRRWDGESVGAAPEVVARVRGADLGLRFTASTTGSYLTGDWWGAWLRPASVTGVEIRTNGRPDSPPRAVVPLAMVDLGARTVQQDCRPQFPQLTRIPRTACTVTAFPGDDLQAAIDLVPQTGGELCMAAGRYVLSKPVVVTGKRRISVTGVGPATVLTGVLPMLGGIGPECMLLFDNCAEVEVTRLRAEGGTGGARLDGALTFTSCSRVRVTDCDLACADAVTDRSQACLSVRGSATGMPRQIVVRDNRLEVGVRQIGILVTDADDTLISGNDIRHVPSAKDPVLPLGLLHAELARIGGDLSPARYGPRLQALRTTISKMANEMMVGGMHRRRALHIAAANLTRDTGPQKAHELVGATGPGQLLNALSGIVVGGQRARTVRILDNLVDGAAQGIHVAASTARATGRDSASEVMISRNTVRVLIPVVYNRGRHAIFVGNTRRLSVLDTVAELNRIGKEELTPVDGVRVHGVLGPQLMIRNTSLTGFGVGVSVKPVEPSPAGGKRLWVVTDTLATGTAVAVSATFPVDPQRNIGVP